MPSLLNDPISANYRQQEVPFSRFGTRKISWFAVRHADTNNSGIIDMVTLNKIIDAIQTQAEIVTIGAPYVSDRWGKFMIAVFEDTAGNGQDTDPTGTYQDNTNSKTLQQVIQDVTPDNEVIVERFYLFGAPATNTDDYYGFSNSDQYQEYNSKAEFDAQSYLNPLGL